MFIMERKRETHTMDDEIKDPNELEEGLDMADEKQQDENEEEGVETHSDY